MNANNYVGKSHENISERRKISANFITCAAKEYVVMHFTGVNEFLTTTPAYENSSTTKRSLNTHKDDTWKLAL